MENEMAIRVLKNMRASVEATPTNSEYTISNHNNDASHLAESFFGRESDHYKILDEAYKLSSPIKKEVILNETDSMIKELQRGILELEKPIEATRSKVNNPTGKKEESIFKYIKMNSGKDLKRVFIVHGHDEEMKQAVARMISKLDLEPIILHEQPNGGKTIIEKFERYADVDFAIILLSPDDLCEGKHRARQNVIMELGYFIAKLGRERVLALYRKSDDFEIPSDYLGVLYTPYDNSMNWRYKMADEMKALDPKIDKNRL